MGMTTTTGLVTVAEYERLKDPPGFRLELHHGEVVEVGLPRKQHSLAQDRLYRLLDRAFDSRRWYVRIEFAFRPAPEYELWCADLAVTALDKWNAVDENSWYPGAPELVIEVPSPSNTGTEMNDKRRTCLDGGCREFWVVDTKNREVHVSTSDRLTRTYRPGEQIPLSLLGTNATITVDDIFKV